MAVTLEECLRILHDLKEVSDASSVEQINTVVADITQIIHNEISDKDADYCCSLVFDKNYGVVSFLQKVVSIDEFQNCKAELLDLLSSFLQKVNRNIINYLVDIKEICVSLFFRDRFAKVKNAAIPLLIKVLELSVGSQVRDELKVDGLINKFFMELTKSVSKLPASVKGNILHLLGVLAEVYPEEMLVYSDRLINLYVSTLKTEMGSKTREPQLPVIAGCLEGLTCYLVNFTQSAQEGSKHSYEMFRLARMAVDPGVHSTRYAVPAAGLRLIARHADQLSEYLLDDYEGMYRKLQKWSEHHNRELLHLGLAALESFLQQVSKMLLSRASEGQREPAVFKFFIKQFLDTMSNHQASMKEISFAVKGYGLLAAPCKMFLKPSDVRYMLSEMINKSEQHFLRPGEDLADRLYSLPSYLHAAASIAHHVDQVSDSHASSIEHLLVLLFENIPLINRRFHLDSQKAILHVLLSLMTKGTTFQQVLSGFVYQSVIRLCSHPVLLDNDQTAEDLSDETDANTKKISYRDFLDPWAGLLNSSQMKDFAALDISLAERHKLTEALYDELLTAILKIMTKLDLSSASTESNEQVTGLDLDESEGQGLSADPIHRIHPNKPKDFQVFINLVDFCSNLLPGHHHDLFSRWMFPFCHTVILLSTKNPLVSGCYKLLAVAMKIANRFHFFKEVVASSPIQKEPMEVDDQPATQVFQQTDTCFQLVKTFSKEVLVRMKQYRDDLLASCLTLILALPKEIIEDQLKDVVPVIQMCFVIGLSYLPLAMVGLEAVEYWSEHLPDHILSPHYKEILPHLDNYLQTAEPLTEVTDSVIIMQSSKSGRGKRKLPTRIVKWNKKDEENKSYESPLSVVQRRILRYLGALGGRANHALLAGAQREVSDKAIAWDSHAHLSFDIPFVDMKPTIYFDGFLPRVVELATRASDRPTKVAACELLHSLVLYCLGRGSQQPEPASKRHPMDRLYKKLFPVVLKLACDVEPVARQLFEELSLQLIHWFTNNKMAESPETMALLDTIFDGLVQPTDTSLRDFSAKCLREFMKWSIKQSSKKVAEKSAVNAKSVLKRIFSFALHPRAFSRLGAALAFNNIYMVFREEDSLVDRFTFQTMVIFVESLALAHTDEKSLGTQTQCVTVLTHLERIIMKRADILRKDSKLREEPREWSRRTVDNAVRWLVRQCGRPHTECRHACMRLVSQLAPLVHGIKSTESYFEVFLKKEGPVYFLSRFEGGGQAAVGNQGLSSCPALTAMGDTFSLSVALQWFDTLLAPLDCYTWAFGQGLLSPAHILSGDGKDKPSIFESIEYFLEHLALSEIGSAAVLFTNHRAADYFSHREIEEYNRAKCTVVVRMWNFLCVILGQYSNDALKVIPDKLWCGRLWELLCKCVLHPSDVGFNVSNVEVMSNLPGQMENTLMVLTKYLPLTHITSLKQTLAEYLQGDRNVFSRLPLTLVEPGLELSTLSQLISGYGHLNKAGLLVGAVQASGNTERLAQQLFDCVYQGIVVEKGGQQPTPSLTPAALSLGRCMMELAFQLGLSTSVLVNSLLDQTKVLGVGWSAEEGHGSLFLSVFKGVVSEHLARCLESIVPLLAVQAATEPRLVNVVMVTVIEHIVCDRYMRKKYGERMVSAVLTQWSHFRSWCVGATSADLQELVVQLLSKLLLLDSKFASSVRDVAYESVLDTYQALLTHPATNLTFKNRVLDLLPFFALVEKPYILKLKSSMDTLIANHFPLKSSELTKDSPRFIEYITAVDKLLLALELSGNPVLLEVIISVFCRESHHAHEDHIEKCLTKFIRKLPADKQKLALDVPYGIFVQEGSFTVGIRKATLERVCLPMLQIANKSAVIEFFLDHIAEVMKTVEAKQVKSHLESQLMSKTCCFQLLEVLYSQLSKEELNTKDSIINQTYCGGQVQTGKELTMKITKCAHEAKSEDVRGETTLREPRRLFHCSAYNLLMAVIACTQTDVKFYSGFLFTDKEAKGQFLLDNIIDKETCWEFQADVQTVMERKKRFVSIRKELKDEQDEGDEVSSFHLASQYLADSSLSEDLSRYDFSVSVSAQSEAGSSGTETTQMPLGRKSTSIVPHEDKEGHVLVGRDYVELEMDDINKHECMATMIGVLTHMKRNNIPPSPAQGSVPSAMPDWMSYLHRKMTSLSCHNNIKLFIAKLVTNTTEIFEPYGKYWLRPLSQLIISGALSSGGINYFVVDIIVTMLSWHKTAIPQDCAEECAMASCLVEFVMRNVYSETRQVFRNNLELLKTLLDCWRDRVHIPYREIYNHLKSADVKSRDSSVGIQLLGIVMACKFPPYGSDAPVDQDRFFAVTANQMRSPYKNVYGAAAEVVGMVLSQLAAEQVTEQVTEGALHTHLLAVMANIQLAKPDQFIVCVHRMATHYPAIGNSFVNRLLFVLPKVRGEFRTICLEVILWNIDKMQNAFLEIESKGLVTFITQRDEGTQLVALNIVRSLLAMLTPSELLTLMPAVTGVCHHTSVACRKLMYDIFMWIYDNYREQKSEPGEEVMSQTKEALLKGLADDDLHCRLLVQNFWSSESRLPVNTMDRMIAMLEAMYSPSTEHQYLSYATSLLLEMTSKSPDYQRPIFEHPLSECTFHECSVQSSWRDHHVVMTPLFAVTQASQAVSQVDSAGGQVRATQGHQFTQTMEGSTAAFNWLTQSSVDTYAEMASFSSPETRSSLLFTVGRRSPQSSAGLDPGVSGAGSRSRHRPVKQGPVKQGPVKQGPAADHPKQESDNDSEIWRLKRRFLKDQEAVRMLFVKRNVRLKQLREVRRREQQLRRESQVTLYRKYRTGDLPDIQIKFSYIIAPLQALALMDSVKTNREIEEAIQQINKSIDHILTESKQYFPPFIACIMDVLHDLRSKLKVDPLNLASSAIVSNLQPLGITVLEEHLIQCAVDPQPSKRSRGEKTTIFTDVALWIELARLYKSVNEYDVLHGIFSGKIETKSITREALECEARGDFHAARRLYDEALSTTSWADGQPLEAEVDLWDDCRMECLDHLTQWQALEEVSVNGMDSSGEAQLGRVWEDTYVQEHYLPNFIRSKLKLLLQGDNSQQSLLTFIDLAMKDGEKKAKLESEFCEPLALLYLWQEDFDRARHYTAMATQRFIQTWISTDSLMVASRSSQLQSLQPLLELDEFLHFWQDESNFLSTMAVEKLVKKWEARSPHKLLDSVQIWDDVVTNRTVYLDKISSRLRKNGRCEDSMDEVKEGLFEETKLRHRLAMAESSMEQNNFSLTLRIMKETHPACKGLGSERLLIEWSHLYAATHHKKAEKIAGSWTEDTFFNILSTLEQLDKYSRSAVLSRFSHLGRRHCALKGRAFAILTNGFLGSDSLPEMSKKTADKLQSYCGVTRHLTHQNIVEKLIEKGYTEMKGCLADRSGGPCLADRSGGPCLADRSDGPSDRAQFGQDAAHLAVALYCDAFLRMKEDDAADLSCAVLEAFPKTVIVCMLRAMKFGSSEAQQRFPRLLQLVESHPDTVADFRKQSSEVPSWMFILWISQMMALLDKHEAPAVQQILLTLAVEYPQAVVYAFHISYEGFTFGNGEQDKSNKAAVNKMRDELTDDHCPLVSRLISALNQFGQPEQLFKDWSEKMKKLLVSGKRDAAQIRAAYCEMYSMLIGHGSDSPHPDATQPSPQSLSSVGLGKYRKRFAQIFQKYFDVKFGENGDKLVNMSAKTFHQLLVDINRKVEEHKKRRGLLIPPGSLREYCQWMADFSPNRERRDLEIPGQYDGLSKPMPEYHIKVAGFDERIMVMSSLRKPKRLIIRGNDEKDYRYLVKNGEDLRMDQRIEQLFGIMNSIMDHDPSCRTRKLNLKTYQVIPMTPRVGLIEWINNTCPLKDFLFAAFTEEEREFFHSEHGPYKFHQKWTNRFFDPKKPISHMYALVYLNYNKTETVREFHKKESKVPWDLSRRAFHQMSTSPEAFHVLRCMFVRSHAVVCICQYLLGIGDRHLCNFMVNLRTGQMVGIDFGHAFGSATQFLPVPELMPFRLTRQVVHMALPLRTKGLLETTMVHVLRALRSNSDLLLNTMDVFVKEPSLDWLQVAEKQKCHGMEPTDAAADDLTWYPKQKVQIARRKLQGANPCHITKDELALGQSKTLAFQCFQEVAMGDKQDSIRANLPAADLSVEQQVAALIDQASDPNLLGRVYIGWEPWV